MTIAENQGTWSGPHAASERLAQQAELASREGRSARAAELYAEAAAQECAALALLDEDASRTYGIVAVSAVALWIKAGRRAQAEATAEKAAAAWFFPAFAAEQISAILSQ